MPSRMRLLPAVALGLTLLAFAAPAAQARARVTIPEFQLEGGAPALSNQLQDGFVLGLVRAGIQVLDPGDTAHKLEAHPELAHCDASPCLKSIGQVLDVGYIVRVKIEVAGNSYKSVARLFSTEGAAPAALPIATESKSCDVCTVAEARATMLRLADAVRSHIDEAVPLPAPVAPPPPRAGAAPRRSGGAGDGRRAGGRRRRRGARVAGELHGDRLLGEPVAQHRRRRPPRRRRGADPDRRLRDDRAGARRRSRDRGRRRWRW